MSQRYDLPGPLAAQEEQRRGAQQLRDRAVRNELLNEARRAYLRLPRAAQADFWQWIRSGRADEERHHG
jgi:hypothetical protein